jgi:hypothetical protein
MTANMSAARRAKSTTLSHTTKSPHRTTPTNRSVEVPPYIRWYNAHAAELALMPSGLRAMVECLRIISPKERRQWAKEFDHTASEAVRGFGAKLVKWVEVEL